MQHFYSSVHADAQDYTKAASPAVQSLEFRNLLRYDRSVKLLKLFIQ